MMLPYRVGLFILDLYLVVLDTISTWNKVFAFVLYWKPDCDFDRKNNTQNSAWKDFVSYIDT